MGLTIRPFTTLEYYKWQLMFLLTQKHQNGTITDKERRVREALDADTDLDAFWGHILWLFDELDENKQRVKEELKTLASTDKDSWAENVLRMALDKREQKEEAPQAPTPEEGKPLVWD